MNTHVLTDRARVDALVAELLACLRAAGLLEVAATIETQETDLAKVATIHDLSDRERVPVVGRQIYLRTAAPWVARTIEAHVDGDAAATAHWADYAAIELARYRNEPRGDAE